MPKWWWSNPVQPDFARGLYWLIDPAKTTVLTEGENDAILAQQYGLPAVAPVTGPVLEEEIIEAPFWYKGKHRRGRKN